MLPHRYVQPDCKKLCCLRLAPSVFARVLFHCQDLKSQVIYRRHVPAYVFSAVKARHPAVPVTVCNLESLLVLKLSMHDSHVTTWGNAYDATLPLVHLFQCY